MEQRQVIKELTQAFETFLADNYPSEDSLGQRFKTYVQNYFYNNDSVLHFEYDTLRLKALLLAYDRLGLDTFVMDYKWEHPHVQQPYLQAYRNCLGFDYPDSLLFEYLQAYDQFGDLSPHALPEYIAKRATSEELVRSVFLHIYVVEYFLFQISRDLFDTTFVKPGYTAPPELRTHRFELMDSTLTELPGIVGKIVDQKTWKDVYGVRHAVLAETINTPDEFGAFRFYVFKNDSNGLPTLHTSYADSLHCGEGDIVVFSDTMELVVTDSDHNNIAEVTFVYTLNCTYDVSPQVRYLITCMDNSFYRIKGYTLDIGSSIPDTSDLSRENYEKDEFDSWFIPHISGRYETDSAFENLHPSVFLNARNLWINVLHKDLKFNSEQMSSTNTNN